MSIALSGCIAASAACTRSSTTSATESHSGLPAVNEMQIKRDLLEGHALPDAVELEVLRQTPSSDASYLEYPTSLASSDDGDIYISDNNGDAIYHATSTLTALNKLPAEDGNLKYPNTIQVRQNEIFISDNEGIKIFDRNGSFERLLRIYYTVFDFALDSAGTIFANPIFSEPKESDSLLVSLNKQGMRVGGFGKRMNRAEHDGLEDRTYICAADDLVIAAFRHRPHVQIYSSKTGELLREMGVSHPAFPGLAELAEDRKFVNPKPGVVRLPVYISGVDVTANKIYVLLCLARPEIVEFTLQGQEMARYRAKSSVSALSYFGFRAHSARNSQQFTLGMMNPYQDPVLMVLTSNAKTNQRKENK
ncbi:MAG TPA: hypothetical protein VN844_01150 [Pyrinomonadaceae bacterium]|nr:hypothetical protein [Pyrinomonadaceae bacterium]